MISEKNLAGSADFTFDYFGNGGFIGCICPDCKSEVKLQIEIYKSGKLVEHLKELFNQSLIDELLERKIIHLKDEKISHHNRLEKYILWNMDALYELISCIGCENAFISIFGMDELQPGREEVQFKGIWKLIS
ncbi:MAG: hypothetical protein ACO1N0_19100 [Fluviicola sp.]